MPRSRTPMLKGTLDMLILQILSEGPRHGYAVAQRIEELTDDVLSVEEGSMYPALYRMEQRGWVESSWQRSEKGRRARVYSVTAAGRARLPEEERNWERFAAAVGKVMPGSTTR